MVEIRSQESDAVKLPNNIRQTGAPGDKIKIYIEDYVVTYLNQIAGLKPSEQKAAILLGEAVSKEKKNIFFISGAVEIEKAEITEESLHLTTETWSGLYEIIEKYFPDKHILGWFLSRPGRSVQVNGHIEKIHTDQFRDKGAIFYLMDPLDREDSFYIYEQGRLIRQPGYYVYYERNAAMQNYLVALRKESESGGENENGGFPNRLFERERDNQIRNEAYHRNHKRKSWWFPQAVAVFLFLLIAMGVRRNLTDRSVSQAVNQLSLQSEQGESTQTLDIVESVMQQASETIDAGDSMTETGSQAADDETDRSEMTEEAGMSGTDEGTETNTDSESVANEADDATASANSYQSYTVKKGDTLMKISWACYQDGTHVDEIIRLNNIEDPDYIYPGMVLQLP